VAVSLKAFDGYEKKTRLHLPGIIMEPGKGNLLFAAAIYNIYSSY
jgi:hypothetical protein